MAIQKTSSLGYAISFAVGLGGLTLAAVGAFWQVTGSEVKRSAAEAAGDDRRAVFAVFNAGPARSLTLPDTAPGWRMVLDTTRPALGPQKPMKSPLDLPAHCVLVFESV